MSVLTQPGVSPEPHGSNRPKLNMKWIIEKVTVPLVVALLGIAASVWAARETAFSTAKSTASTTAKDTAKQTAYGAIQEQQQRTSGGTITPTGKILNRIGRTFTVAKEGTGLYKITFDTPFGKDPVALATPLRDPPTTIIRVVEVDERSVLFTTRHYGNNNSIDAAFSFMVLESIESHALIAQ
jgi:hypothetical protein